MLSLTLPTRFSHNPVSVHQKRLLTSTQTAALTSVWWVEPRTAGNPFQLQLKDLKPWKEYLGKADFNNNNSPLGS